MDGDSRFVAPVLEALSNLNFTSNEILAESVLNKALVLLSSANSNDLPTVLKFLLQFPVDDYIPQIVSSIRKELKIDSILDRGNDSTQSKTALQAKDCEKLVFEALRSGMRFKQNIATSFAKLLKKLSAKVNKIILFSSSSINI